MLLTGVAPTSRRERWLFWLPVLTVALLLRLYFFNGVSLADDVNYWTQAIATGLHGSWPPLKLHWNLRLGLVLPCAALLKIFGLKLWAPYIFTIVGGLLEILLTYFLARRYFSEGTARLAAWFCVFFPLNILYSSYLYVDLWAGVIGALSIYYWHRGLVEDRSRYYALASFYFGLAWLFRETILMCWPIFLGLWIQSRRRPNRKFFWVVLPALLILGGEALMYQIFAGNWHYRPDAIFEARGQLFADLSGRRGFWAQPFVELVTSHELGLFTAAALAITVLNYKRIPAPFGLWLLVGFIWLCWGTTVPVAWLPLQGDPRYLTVLTIPTLVVLAWFVAGLRSPVQRGVLIALLLGSGLVCASADIGRVKLSAHRRLPQSIYNQATTAAEPFVYFGARAVQNFSTNGINFALATDLGRASACKQIRMLPGTRTLSIAKAHFIILSAQMQPEKWEAKVKEGWQTVEVMPGDHLSIRDVAVRFLTFLGQPTRRYPAVKRPALVIMRNPAWQPTNTALPTIGPASLTVSGNFPLPQPPHPE